MIDPTTHEPAPANGDGLDAYPATGHAAQSSRTLSAVDLLDELAALAALRPYADAAVLGTLTVTAPDALAAAIATVRGRL
jgi:hypothetical protein